MKCLNLHRKVIYQPPPLCKCGSREINLQMQLLGMNEMFRSVQKNQILPTPLMEVGDQLTKKLQKNYYMKHPVLHRELFANLPPLMGMEVSMYTFC